MVIVRSAVCPVLRIVVDREGPIDKTGVGQTKYYGVAAVKCKSPQPPHRCTRQPRQPYRSARHLRRHA